MARLGYEGRSPEGENAPALEGDRKIGPVGALSVFDAICIVVGISIGAGIFKTPGLVAGYAGSWQMMLAAWLIGGLFSLCGAVCYGHLAGLFPQAGGEYVYITQAYGHCTGFLFAWARMTVVQTGSIASIAYIFGDYATEISPVGTKSSTLYASLAVVTLTITNMLGIKVTKSVQNVLSGALVVGLCLILAASLSVKPDASSHWPGASATAGTFGLALVFVLYTYGGWNEAAYVTAELRGQRRNMWRVLVISTSLLIGVYLMTNVAYLRILGFDNMRESTTVGSSALAIVLGQAGRTAIAVLVILTTLSSVNGCIFTGARSIYAIGTDHAKLRWFGRWHKDFGTPFNALLAQGFMALALIVSSGIADRFRRSFETTVEYTAPVFWFFLLLTGLSVFVHRRKKPMPVAPFQSLSFYLVVLLFCITAAYLLYSSLIYTRLGAIAGIGVLLMGFPVYFVSGNLKKNGT